ncbi:hypothetical protein ZWY2020_035877 [Hordeum vulgare]|nr:hypothetical protein ZWY2020_035877 [Hordeum vulgare]
MLFCVFMKAGHSDERNRIESKVIEYCNKHVQAKPVDAWTSSDTDSAAATPAAPVEDLKNWDAEVVKVDQATLFDLILCPDVELVTVAAAAVSTASPHASDAVVVEGKTTVLVAENLGAAGPALLWVFANVNCSYDLCPEGSGPRSRSTNVGRDVFEASGSRLRIVGRVGVGIGIDNGYLVVNAPIANTAAAPEDGIALMCTMGRQIEDLERGTLTVNSVPVDSYLTRSPSLFLRRVVVASTTQRCRPPWQATMAVTSWSSVLSW